MSHLYVGLLGGSFGGMFFGMLMLLYRHRIAEYVSFGPHTEKVVIDLQVVGIGATVSSSLVFMFLITFLF